MVRTPSGAGTTQTLVRKLSRKTFQHARALRPHENHANTPQRRIVGAKEYGSEKSRKASEMYRNDRK